MRHRSVIEMFYKHYLLYNFAFYPIPAICKIAGITIPNCIRENL